MAFSALEFLLFYSRWSVVACMRSGHICFSDKIPEFLIDLPCLFSLCLDTNAESWQQECLWVLLCLHIKLHVQVPVWFFLQKWLLSTFQMWEFFNLKYHSVIQDWHWKVKNNIWFCISGEQSRHRKTFVFFLFVERRKRGISKVTNPTINAADVVEMTEKAFAGEPSYAPRHFEEQKSLPHIYPSAEDLVWKIWWLKVSHTGNLSLVFPTVFRRNTWEKQWHHPDNHCWVHLPNNQLGCVGWWMMFQ